MTEPRSRSIDRRTATEIAADAERAAADAEAAARTVAARPPHRSPATG
jgi:hypothetical protein